MVPKIDGDKLRDIREEKLLTQEQLGKLAGITATTIHRLEKGKTGAQKSTVLRLAAALDVHPGEFLKREGGVPLGPARNHFPDEMKTLLPQAG